MRLYEAFLQEPDDVNRTITAHSPGNHYHQDTVLKNIVVLKMGTGFLLPVRYNTPALVLSTDTANVLLGYFDPKDTDRHDKKTVMDGDMYLSCGETRAVRTSEDGSIELVNIFVREDGEIVTTSLVSYNKENELTIKVEKLILDMMGANSGGNLVWSQDPITGNNTFAMNFKANNKDVGPRMTHTYKGTLTGPKDTFIWDVTPTPIGVVPPALTTIALPLSLHLGISPQSPLDLALMALAAPLFSITLSPLGDLLIKNPINQAEISMSAIGAVTIKSAAGLGSVSMSPLGAIKVSSKANIEVNALAGVKIVGAGQELLQQLLTFLTQYSTHIHPTGTGPSGPPVTASGTLTGPYAKIMAIKGV